MPLYYEFHADYKMGRTASARWEEFRGGLNILLKENEIADNDLAQADDIMLTGKGVPTKRWGSANYFMAGTTMVKDIEGYYKPASSVNELLALTNDGFLVKKSGASYAICVGTSWASSAYSSMSQLNNNMYIVDSVKELSKYNGTTITRFTQIGVPTGVTASNLSGASGTFSYSWRVSAEGLTGETLASNRVILANLPQDLTETSVRVAWSTSSPASQVAGYVIYGREAGNERFIARVPSNTLRFDDTGADEPYILAEPPTADSTGGPIAKYIERHDNRLIIAGIVSQPNRVMISGKATFAEYFHWSKGGAYIDIDTDSGDAITGIKSFQNKLIIFKERSIWELVLTETTLSNYTVTLPTATLITSAHGCVSHKTITPVENDLFFLTREGVYVLGYQENMTDILRTNELSAKIRSFFTEASYSDLSTASANYIDNKYVISLLSSKKTAVFDRERLGWLGKWATSYGINSWYKYYDSSGVEQWLAATDDGYITYFSEDLKSDRGVAFTSAMKTKKYDFGGWDSFKYVSEVILKFRNVSGKVNISMVVETRDGETSVASDFTIESSSTNAGWASGMWGDAMWGDSEASGTASDVSDIIKRIIIGRTVRSIQLYIQTNNTSDNYELLGVTINGKPEGRGSMPHDWLIS